MMTTPDPDALAHFDALAMALATDAGRECEECSRTFARTRGESNQHWAMRRFCGRSCSGSWSARRAAEQRRAAQIEDLEWIVGTDSPEHIARRLGYASVSNLERVLHRWGRHDLANRLERAS
jgi:hypothetical protein